jgi:hypothetical protein
MRRREFVLSAAALAGAGAAAFWQEQKIAAVALYPGHDEGHRLRDARELPEPDETIETEVVIAGSGVAGLTAAWQLTKRGVRDVLQLTGPEEYGNAASGQSGELAFPTGAHYLPLPSLESVHIREMLSDFVVIVRDAFSERPVFDELYLVHAPAERVLYRSAWQEGYLPTESIETSERAEHARFFDAVDTFSTARGSDGLRAFVVPLAASSSDERFRALDRVTFKTWLATEGFVSPSLHWYLDYCCRDDYGRHYSEISAWAGLYYFCSRGGLAANAERGAVLTWPQGLAALADSLHGAAQVGTRVRRASVARLREVHGGVEALCVVAEGSALRSFRVKARYAVAAMPLYVLQHVLAQPQSVGFDGARDVPAYAPWMVSNFVMRAFPEEQPGAALSWDNVVYREPGLGYVVSTHQDIRMSRPERTCFTAYHALSDLEPAAARRWLETASVHELSQLASQDLRLAYGWRLAPCVERVEITVRGHAMAVPQPGFLSNPGRAALRAADGPIFFAHSDLSGLSLFEEASWWGYRAAARIAAARH